MRLLTCALVALVLLTACADVTEPPTEPPTPPPGPQGPGVVVSASYVSTGVFWLKLSWRYGADDGRGPVDSVIVRETFTGDTAQNAAHRHAAAVLRDSFLLASTYGVIHSGTGCMRSKRRALESADACVPWSYTEGDVPPPPPIPDTTVVGLQMKPDTTDLFFGGQEWFCTFLVFPDSARALIGGQWGTPCDAAEAALPLAQWPSTAQQAAASVWLSCAIEADGRKRCRDQYGTITEESVAAS